MKKLRPSYLYEFKNLPRASYEQFVIPPRDRIIPEDQLPGDPKELSFEDAERLSEKRAEKSAEWEQSSERPSGRSYDPWANWKNKT